MYASTLIAAMALATRALAMPMPDGLAEKQTPYTGPYTMYADLHNGSINGLEVQAADLHFFLGRSGPRFSCEKRVDYCPKATDTVLIYGGLFVSVPGGQETYVKKDGALAFTHAHGPSKPDFFSEDLYARADGTYAGPDGVGLAACPVDSKDESQQDQFQVFAQIPSFTRTDCLSFDVKIKAWTVQDYGAWEYD